MALGKDIVSNLDGYSAAMYSTWLYYRPARLLFDAGEGVCLSMKNFIFGIESVLISHGHYDHIGGIAGMIYTRAAARGDKEKPLTIYYPMGTGEIDDLLEYVKGISGRVRYELGWVAVKAGDRLEIGDRKTIVKAFPADHVGHIPCLGYAVVENRRRLRREYAGLAGAEIAAVAREKGSEAINEEYEKVLLAYSGDSNPVNPDYVRGAEVLVHEATFVNPDDADRKGHSSVIGAVEAAARAEAVSLVLYHISGRYLAREAVEAIGRAVASVGYRGDVYLLYGRDMVRVA